MEAMDAELPTLRKAAAALPETDKGFRSTVDQVLAMLVWLDPENNQPITEVKIEQARRRRHSAASGSEYDASHA